MEVMHRNDHYILQLLMYNYCCSVCRLKHLIESIYTFSINEIILISFAFPLQRVLAHHEDQALLKAYIAEWRKFFAQCDYLPTPFRQLESSLAGKNIAVQKKGQSDESIVRKVRIICY